VKIISFFNGPLNLPLRNEEFVQIENLVQKTQQLQAMQIKPDSPEALEKLPSLNLIRQGERKLYM